AVKMTASKSAKVKAQKGIKKLYLKTSPECRVTFKLPREAAPGNHTVTIVGDFNNWSADETPMKKLKSGDYQIVLKLPSNREYRFRYLIDSKRWENDWCADKYIQNPFGCDDSVVVV
ncbi:MAG: isoamylase early set domain-containing protein, partial [Nitrospiraceae bacterium]